MYVLVAAVVDLKAVAAVIVNIVAEAFYQKLCVSRLTK